VISLTNEALIHDVAFALSWQVLEVCASCLREAERRDAFTEIYQCIKTGIECFENLSNKIEWRFDPGRN